MIFRLFGLTSKVDLEMAFSGGETRREPEFARDVEAMLLYWYPIYRVQPILLMHEHCPVVLA